MAFEENKHPRDKNGQFTSKGSGNATGGAKQETPKKNLDSNIKDLQQKRKEAIKNYNRTGDDKYSNEERELEKQINGLKDRKVDQLSGKEIEDDGVDDKNKSLYNDKQIEDFESKLNSDNTVVVEINGKKYIAEYRGESRKNKGYADIQIPELIDRWGDKEPIRDDLGNVVRDGKLYIDYNNLTHAKPNVDDERKQAYKLFDLPF